MGRSATYVALWSVVALGFALALLVAEGQPWPAALAAGVGSALPAALLGLVVLAACERFPWRRAGNAGLVVGHALGAVVFSSIWCGVIVLEMAFRAPRASVASFLRAGVPWQLMMGLVVYGVLAGLAYARAARRREDEQRRAAERAETLRLRAELGALRARLEPHFLFNVLQTIGTLAHERPAQVHVALEQLAALLRRRLHGAGDAADADLATLAEELADMREYVSLEALRYGERLHLVEDVDDDALDCLLPRFTLQPLVENAVRHGLAVRAAGGRVTVAARVEDAPDGARRGWTLSVADDGVGADPARFEAGAGIGVSVVRERLRLRFGADAGLVVTTAPGAGCRVALRLPVSAP